jgi:hypothetical protein
MKIKNKLKFFWTILFVLIILLSISFIFQINIIASETKLIHTYTERLEIANKENELLVISFVEKNSLSGINDSIELFSFERVEVVHYIEVSDGLIVAR